jgi:hypothetical protein
VCQLASRPKEQSAALFRTCHSCRFPLLARPQAGVEIVDVGAVGLHALIDRGDGVAALDAPGVAGLRVGGLAGLDQRAAGVELHLGPVGGGRGDQADAAVLEPVGDRDPGGVAPLSLLGRDLNFNIERLDIENCTGYATVAYGSASPCSGTIRHVRAWNSNVCFEQLGDTSGGITLIDCKAYSAPRDGGAAVSFGCEAFLHLYSAASNITVIRFWAEGDTSLAGFLPVIAGVPGDVEDITLIDCQFHMTGEGAAISAISADGYNIKRLRLIGSTFSAPNRASGPAIQFTDCEDVEAIGCRFVGKAGGVYLTVGSTAEFTACNVLAVSDDPEGGPYGIYSDASEGAVRVNGGSITATGSVPVAYVGPVVVSSATDTTPTQSSAAPGPRAGTANSGGGIAAGNSFVVPVEGFDATGYAVVFRVWGGGENGANPKAVSVGTVTKTDSGFSATVFNDASAGQVLHVEWIAVPH